MARACDRHCLTSWTADRTDSNGRRCYRKVPAGCLIVKAIDNHDGVAANCRGRYYEFEWDNVPRRVGGATRLRIAIIVQGNSTAWCKASACDRHCLTSWTADRTDCNDRRW